MTIMANAIIDEDTGVALDYRQIIKNPKLKPVWIKSFANGIDMISQEVGGRMEVTDTIFYYQQQYI